MLRIFPRRTAATPDDEGVRVGPPGLFDAAEEIHVSATFTWDRAAAEKLAAQWERVGEVKIGGPAYDAAGGDFVPGRYLKHGYVITSRGCPNRCWFCSVWRREGQKVRELPITQGWNVLDDNLLACSGGHIRAVFAMLHEQTQPVKFTGGLEAARLKPWHVDLLADLKPKRFFFAYDTPDDYEPLLRAGQMLTEAGLRPLDQMQAYVLIGYPTDTVDYAHARLLGTADLGFMPQAMYYRGPDGLDTRNAEWRALHRCWSRPAIARAMLRKEGVL